jgi:hypothetical protein
LTSLEGLDPRRLVEDAGDAERAAPGAWRLLHAIGHGGRGWSGLRLDAGQPCDRRVGVDTATTAPGGGSVKRASRTAARLILTTYISTITTANPINRTMTVQCHRDQPSHPCVMGARALAGLSSS